MVEAPLSSLSPLNTLGPEAEVVIRQECCPTCGAMFSTDIHLGSEDPAMLEMRRSIACAPKPGGFA